MLADSLGDSGVVRIRLSCFSADGSSRQWRCNSPWCTPFNFHVQVCGFQVGINFAVNITSDPMWASLGD